MDKSALVGRCGLYCGACVIYRAERDDPEWQKRLAEHFKCPPEKVSCQGCGVLTPNCWGNDCGMVKCLNEKGYEFCYECSEYEAKTCDKFEEIWKRYAEEDSVDLRMNLSRIKEGKVEEWLRESEKLYTCPHCGKPITTGAKKCHHCNLKL